MNLDSVIYNNEMIFGVKDQSLIIVKCRLSRHDDGCHDIRERILAIHVALMNHLFATMCYHL